MSTIEQESNSQSLTSSSLQTTSCKFLSTSLLTPAPAPAADEPATEAPPPNALDPTIPLNPGVPAGLELIPVDPSPVGTVPNEFEVVVLPYVQGEAAVVDEVNPREMVGLFVVTCGIFAEGGGKCQIVLIPRDVERSMEDPGRKGCLSVDVRVDGWRRRSESRSDYRTELKE